MAININTILGWFKSGKKPTEQQFADSWKSFWHKDDSIPQTAIENLETSLDEKATREEFEAHINDPDAHGGNGVVPTLDQVTQSAATSLKPITVQDVNPSTGEKLSTVVYGGMGISSKPEGGNWTNLVLQSGSSDSIITVPASDNDETVAYQSYVAASYKIVNTYADMISDGVPGRVLLYLVLNDEVNNPGQPSEYRWWPNDKLMWNASVQIPY